MRLRQVVLVAKELDPVVETLCGVFDLDPGFSDPGVAEFGLKNAVIPVGDTFLEVVSPVAQGTAAGRFLHRRGGDGGYMVMVQVEDMAAARRRMAKLGVRMVWTADHKDIRGTHLHPKDVGGAILSLDEATPPESWRWAGPDWRSAVRTSAVREITAVEIEASSPHTVARRWSQVLDRPTRRRDDGTCCIELDGGAVRFVEAGDGGGEGVCGFDLAVEDRAVVQSAARDRGLSFEEDGILLAGVRFRLL